MIVSKVLNNNIVSTVDEQDREIILVGRGLGWGAKVGGEVDRSKIEKVFRMDTADSTNRLKQLLLEVSVEAVEASTQIIEYARNVLNKRLNKKRLYHVDRSHQLCSRAEQKRSRIPFPAELGNQKAVSAGI